MNPATETLVGDDAKALYRLGRTLRRITQDLFEAYIMSYHVEDPKVAGKVWEVVREQKKDGEEISPATWSAQVLPTEKTAGYKRSLVRKKVHFED
eukprot:CAMPEP_0175759836 /NCGR_PEP_ID=MMETSP0097-20121207/65779_1 /TAXON_ID=311494 /ORGANISM="Alexandrium monilatum, Strain CCMP3105" /LENGTH=94 /DNA_ID=CAMNT_0017069251 /DNA_START=87 /DNA_END=371 /DNA_ORIENTATION=+